MSDSVGSVSVDVVPDARGWSEKLRAQLRDVSVDVKANAETEEANAKLDEMARTRTAKVKVNVDKNPLEQGASALDKFVGQLGLIPALAITAGSALVPLAGVLGGIAAALAAPLVFAGGGLTLFAFLGGLAVKDTEKQLKAVDQASAKLATLTKGTKEYAQQQQIVKDLQAGLTPEQKKFAEAQNTVTGAFQKFLAGSGGKSLLDVMAQGLTVLAHILPLATPIITEVGGALSKLLDQADRAAQSDGFKHFLGQVSNLIGPTIVKGGHIIGELAKGLGSLLLVAGQSGFSHGLVSGLSSMARSFSDWASSKSARHDVSAFFEYAHKNGPQVAHTLASIGRALAHVVEALAPLGPPVLKVVQGIATAISKIPIPVLTALAGATAGLVAFQKVGGLKAASALSGLGKGGSAGGVGGILGNVGVQKVFVVNLPPGGLGGGGVPGGAGGAATAAEEAGIGATVAARTGLFSKIIKGLGLDLPLPAAGGIRKLPMTPIPTSTLHQEFVDKYGGSKAMPPTPALQAFSVSPAEARTLLNIPQIKAAGTAYDALKQHAARASAQIDLIGPHAQQSTGGAIKAVGALQSKINSLHDKKLAIIANTQSAIHSLEALQAFRLKDKYLTVYERYQRQEQAVGPGGGMGRPRARGGWITGPGTGTSDSILTPTSNGEFVVRASVAAQNRAFLEQLNAGKRPSYAPRSAGGGSGFPDRVTLMLEDGTALSAYVSRHADGVYHANRGYEHARGEMSR